MNIYILPIDRRFRPDSQPFTYPVNNDDFGIEQDFFKYINKNKHHNISNSPDLADWHYLPVYWTRWHLNHNYGKDGQDELQKAVDKAIVDSGKTFTVCQYDDGPIIDLSHTEIFYGSRKFTNGHDVPLLRNKMRLPIIRPKKLYTASFIGRLNTHPIREKMSIVLSDIDHVLIEDSNSDQKFFIDKTLRSYASLCPRGYGGSSFRFFEAMQMGVVPILIGDYDTRPFKKYIDWEEVSFYANSPETAKQIINTSTNGQLRRMGIAARKIYLKELRFGKWCKYVIQELEDYL